MMTEADKLAQLRAKYGRGKPGSPYPPMPVTAFASDAPAPALNGMIEKRGPELSEVALKAWNARLAGEPLIDVAHSLGLSIEAAKVLIREAYSAISEDLKAALEHNREFDLERTDLILRAFLPLVREGDPQAAGIVLKALAHRAKLTGLEPLASPQDKSRANPQNVLVWVQQQLPAINKIVAALPPEL